MNIYGSSEQELSNRRRKQKQYRDTLEEQIKEKQRLKQSQLRLRTEEKRGSLNSPRINTRESNTNHSSITRKNNYQSNFLPSINANYAKKSFINGHQRTSSYEQEPSRIIQQDTDIETIQALAQCDIIIENLRRLRLKSLSSMKKKQKNYKLNLEGSPYSFDKYTQRNDSYPRHKQSLAQQQVMMFRAWQPGQQYKNRKDRNKNQSLKSKQTIKLDEEENERDSSLADQSLIPHTIQFQYNSSHGESGDFEGSIDKELEGQEEGLQAQKNKEQRQRAQKRQKFLLKYLGRAKMRGAKLQEKIVNFRNKTINVPEGRERSEEQNQIQQSRNRLENEFESVDERKNESQNSKSHKARINENTH